MPATVSYTTQSFPFGEEMAAQHAGGDYATRYKFNGKELDPQTGYYYYGARYYDPVISRWLSIDPLAEKYPGLSPYNYTANNPVMLVDPDGKRTEPPVNGLDWFADDTGEYFWNEEKQVYEHYAYYDESYNTFFVGYYSADEFAEPVGDYDIIFDLSNIKPKDEYNPEHTISSLATPLIEFLEASDGNPFNESDFKDISDPDKYPGVKILSHPNMNGGITLGNLIIVGDNYDDALLDHEYGHYLDFKYHFKYDKLAYLTTIGLPSLVSAIINDAESHLNSISERRANRLGGAWSDNYELKNLHRNAQ